MNVEDIQIDYSQFEGRDLIDVVFLKQRQLMDHYEVPEIDLDIPKDQQHIRAMAWSVIEEAGEALEVFEGTQHKNHLGDEFADMLHFYLELLIMSGLTSEDLKNEMEVKSFQDLDNKVKSYWNPKFEKENYILAFKDFTVILSLAVNTLKNRFWRKTNIKTEVSLYHERLLKTISLFFHFASSCGMTPDLLFDYYLKKNEVNLFRIRSKY